MVSDGFMNRNPLTLTSSSSQRICKSSAVIPVAFVYFFDGRHLPGGICVCLIIVDLNYAAVACANGSRIGRWPVVRNKDVLV